MTERNEPCPCGSGKKFKKCHGAPLPVPPDQLRALYRKATKETERKSSMRREKYGRVRPIIHADFKGKKYVGVGSELHGSAHWRTVPDFLSDYLQRFLAGPWYQVELEKPLENRHPLAQWYWHHCACQARAERRDDGLLHGSPDGPSMAFTALAYELYLLDDHMLVQQKLRPRLLHPQHFQAARYEVTVAAAMVRAGFKLEMEDEDDPSTPHPEFIAIDRTTGLRIAVEAKSRHRPGILGHPGALTNGPANLAHDVRRLFREAVKKKSNLPLFVFLDINLPSEVAESHASTLETVFKPMIIREARPINNHGITVGNPHNLLMVTNIPYHYGQPGERIPDALFWSYSPLPQGCMHPVPREVISRVETSLEQAANIPNFFDDEPPI
jgi:hypothetical protein